MKLRIISSTLSCDAITEAIGENPTRCIERGERIARSSAPLAAHTTWVIESREVDDVGEALVSAALDDIQPALDALMRSSLRFDERTVVVVMDGRWNGSQLNLTFEELTRIVSSGCDLIVDAYCVGDDVGDGPLAGAL